MKTLIIHLHAELQYKLLPILIKSFPDIQFIISTHSPLFLLGLSEQDDEYASQIVDVGTGAIINAEQFSELESAVNFFKNSSKFSKYIKSINESEKKNIVLLEGDLDKKYINTAATLLGKEKLLESLTLFPVDGKDELNKFWNCKSIDVGNLIGEKIILLYDCDCKKENKDSGNFYLRSLPLKVDHKIQSGIENLFDDTTINKISKVNGNYINDRQIKDKIRGEKSSYKEFWIDPDEKPNVCNWLCENGDSNDFRYFDEIFTMIQQIINK